MMRLGTVRISKCAPRIKLTVQWGCEQPAGELALYMKRVGTELEFAAYPPIDVAGGEITFQFDDLLFSRKYGRYEGRFTVGGVDYTKLQVEYVEDSKIVSAENPSV